MVQLYTKAADRKLLARDAASHDEHCANILPANYPN
jgi:hypothetical protein